jgi:hypothetical protein
MLLQTQENCCGNTGKTWAYIMTKKPNNRPLDKKKKPVLSMSEDN